MKVWKDDEVIVWVGDKPKYYKDVLNDTKEQLAGNPFYRYLSPSAKEKVLKSMTESLIEALVK